MISLHCLSNVITYCSNETLRHIHTTIIRFLILNNELHSRRWTDHAIHSMSVEIISNAVQLYEQKSRFKIYTCNK